MQEKVFLYHRGHVMSASNWRDTKLVFCFHFTRMQRQRDRIPFHVWRQDLFACNVARSLRNVRSCTFCVFCSNWSVHSRMLCAPGRHNHQNGIASACLYFVLFCSFLIIFWLQIFGHTFVLGSLILKLYIFCRIHVKWLPL